MTLLPPSNVYDLTQVSDFGALIRTFESVNQPLPGQSEVRGTAWILTIADQSSNLSVGVRGEVGALTWSLPDRRYVPRTGLNEGYVEYFRVDGYEAPQLPESEVPIDVAFRAAEEYFMTRRQPTCVRWVPALYPTSSLKLPSLGTFKGWT